MWLGRKKAPDHRKLHFPSATLSVCCITNSSGPFTRAALEPLREAADEIVIAAGGPVPEEDLRYYGEVADTVYSIEFAYIERHLSWLHAQCHGDWILRLDGDEIPSASMVSEVLAAKDDRDISSVLFARRHPFPNLHTYISQEPWYPDFQVRMVRNDGTLRFAGLQHTSAERTLPARIVEAPIYHLSLIGSKVEEREARARRYESLRPGLVAPTGLPVNDSLFPERLPYIITASIPPDDRKQIEMTLAASGPTRGASDTIPVKLDTMDVYWSGRELSESAYKASTKVIGSTVPFSPGETRPVYFRICNEGTERWGWDPSTGPYLHMVHRLLDGNSEPVTDWRISWFTEWVNPGMTTIVPGQIDAPSEAGLYTLESGVRHSSDRIFGEVKATKIVVRPGGAWAS